MREKYQIAFQKTMLQNGDSSNIAITNLNTSAEIALHLESGNAIETQDQIDSINDAIASYQANSPYDEFWGQVGISYLWIYPAQNNVTVGAGLTSVPIPDFLQLLQEWLTFIGQ